MDTGTVDGVRAVGEKAVAIMRNTARYLQSHRSEHGILVKTEGSPLTVADVKMRIMLLFRMYNLVATGGFAFAVGEDTSRPHALGTDSDVIRVWQPIVCDLIPQDNATGYFFDITRTWCMGFSSPPVEAAYRDVLAVFETVASIARVGVPGSALHRSACEWFEAKGHSTGSSANSQGVGFIHALGHGVGRRLHEPPYLRYGQGNANTLAPGCVIAVEPGLYYPYCGGFGVRIEDCMWMDPASDRLASLATLSKELVLPYAGGS